MLLTLGRMSRFHDAPYPLVILNAAQRKADLHDNDGREVKDPDTVSGGLQMGSTLRLQQTGPGLGWHYYAREFHFYANFSNVRSNTPNSVSA